MIERKLFGLKNRWLSGKVFSPYVPVDLPEEQVLPGNTPAKEQIELLY